MNRCAGFCRPLPNHSATPPASAEAGAASLPRNPGRHPDGGRPRLEAALTGSAYFQPHERRRGRMSAGLAASLFVRGAPFDHAVRDLLRAPEAASPLQPGHPRTVERGPASRPEVLVDRPIRLDLASAGPPVRGNQEAGVRRDVGHVAGRRREGLRLPLVPARREPWRHLVAIHVRPHRDRRILPGCGDRRPQGPRARRPSARNPHVRVRRVQQGISRPRPGCRVRNRARRPADDRMADGSRPRLRHAVEGPYVLVYQRYGTRGPPHRSRQCSAPSCRWWSAS